MRVPVIVALAIVFGASPALAVDDALLECRDISDAAQRLACYDTAVDRLAKMPAEAEAPVVAAPGPADETLDAREARLKAMQDELARREQALATERAQYEAARKTDELTLFGVPMPAINLTQTDQLQNIEKQQETKVVERTDDGAVDVIEVRVNSFSKTPKGDLVAVLANGTVWRQVDSKDVRIPKGDGHFVRIERAALGSYFLYINAEGRAIRVRRVDGVAGRG